MKSNDANIHFKPNIRNVYLSNLVKNEGCMDCTIGAMQSIPSCSNFCQNSILCLGNFAGFINAEL